LVQSRHNVPSCALAKFNQSRAQWSGLIHPCTRTPPRRNFFFTTGLLVPRLTIGAPAHGRFAPRTIALATPSIWPNYRACSTERCRIFGGPTKPAVLRQRMVASMACTRKRCSALLLLSVTLCRWYRRLVATSYASPVRLSTVSLCFLPVRRRANSANVHIILVRREENEDEEGADDMLHQFVSGYSL
jgi:hypothetical protein